MNDAPAPDPKLPAARRTRMIAMLLYFIAVSTGVIWLWHGHVYITRWADEAALCVALICVLAAGRLLYESFDRRLLGERMQVEGESTPKEARHARLQAALMCLLGLVLVLPNVTFGLNWSPVLAYVGVVAYVVVRLAYALKVWRTSDEYVRRRISETGWWALLITTTGLLLYGGAERLGLVQAASSWDVLVLVVGVTILTPTFLFRKASNPNTVN
jgi:hypothetical protein